MFGCPFLTPSECLVNPRKRTHYSEMLNKQYKSLRRTNARHDILRAPSLFSLKVMQFELLGLHIHRLHNFGVSSRSSETLPSRRRRMHHVVEIVVR